MKRFNKIVMFLAFFCIVFSNISVKAYASGKEYTYTVRFSTAGEAYFEDFDNNIVITTSDGSGKALVSKSAKINLSEDRTVATVTGLKYGDRIVFNVNSATKMNEGSKYYIKGVRISGRDEYEAAAAFAVTKDANYVVAYGVAANLVGYTVNYVDSEGTSLLESAKYYGNVGDKPVVAYRYIENYTPTAYNLTKTLSSNEEENVFNFVY